MQCAKRLTIALALLFVAMPASAEKKNSAGDTTPDEPAAAEIDSAENLYPGANPHVAQPDVLPKRLGPAQLELPSAQGWVGLGLAAQLRLANTHMFATGGQQDRNEVGVEFRRIRLKLSAGFLNEDVLTSVQFNIAPNALELIDLWFSFRFWQRLTARIGQFTIPFTRYRAQSFAALMLTDWAPVTRMFGAERQLGVEVFAAQGGKMAWEYVLGVFTGVAARASHGVEITSVYGETAPNPSDLRTFSGPTELHPEIVARVARNFGDIATDQTTDTKGGPLRHSIGLSVAWDIQPEVRRDLVARFAAEWLAKFYHGSFNATGYLALFEGEDGVGFGPWGFLVQAGWRWSEIWEVALRYSYTHITEALRDDATAYADQKIGKTTDLEEIRRYQAVGQQTTEEELALAINAYIIGNSIKAQLEGAWLTGQVESGRLNGLSIVGQLQFMF